MTSRLLKKVFFFFSPVGLFSWYSCALTRYFADVFFSGITENKSENEISLFSLLEKLTIKFSSLRRLVLTFDFCKRKASLHKFLRRIFDKSHPAHKKDRYKIFSLFSLSLSLCFHDNRRTTLLTRSETNFSILVPLYIRVVINAAVLFLSSSHFENERVGERESAERRERE